ncbi:unnamed protein product [Adineta steineri]|uniref:Uncharacterized protein n=1 Tax=Adineta steineri TaxID=433720 RepID=A0A819ARZ4_9BILA|nr:unnamed protein product [Adineta steineri]CAF3789222.1 unnamed protein product [Adineta steineri]
MLRMLHPSSGRRNFDVISTQTASNNNNNQASQAITETQDTVQTVDKTEIEEKTKNAIGAANESQSQTSSNNPTAIEKK